MFFDAMWARFGWEMAGLLAFVCVAGAFIGAIVIYAAVLSVVKRIIGTRLW